MNKRRSNHQFGRLGKMFGTIIFGLEPDLITVAKGITSAYAPLSASIISEKVWSVIRDRSEKCGAFGHGYTYTAHPLAAIAAITNLEIIEQDNLVTQAGNRGEYLHLRLQDQFAGHPSCCRNSWTRTHGCN